ncbi:MAG: hypothetical protein EOO22_06815 [Comamonadaceae bacterium]|nr:MAG: hypothetical protein EOO22_06815 [Comamonadaceae bacterium]
MRDFGGPEEKRVLYDMMDKARAQSLSDFPPDVRREADTVFKALSLRMIQLCYHDGELQLPNSYFTGMNSLDLYLTLKIVEEICLYLDPSAKSKTWADLHAHPKRSNSEIGLQLAGHIDRFIALCAGSEDQPHMCNFAKELLQRVRKEDCSRETPKLLKVACVSLDTWARSLEKKKLVNPVWLRPLTYQLRLLYSEWARMEQKLAEREAKLEKKLRKNK